MTKNVDLQSAGRSREYWRSLEELAETPGFQEWLDREFPQGASEMRDPMTRRSFLKLMGASLALASLTGCQFAIKPPQEKIVPYVRQPELVIPGKPLFYATAYTQHGYALGLLAENHEGRPTKLEGNPDHPSSLGATDTFAQASILTMYDPDRSTGVINAGQPSTWEAFLAAVGPVFDQVQAAQGAGLRILTETTTSPTLAGQIQGLLASLPQARWYQYEPLARDSATAGARLAFGQDAHPVYNFANARVVLALDSDFTATGVGSVRYARDFADGRRVRRGQATMNRLYVAEPSPTPTGSIADHRLPIRASLVESLARAVAIAVGVAGATAGAQLSEKEAQFAAAVAADLQANGANSLVIAGDGQPAIVHALAHAINQTLGSVGTTVTYTDPVDANPAIQIESLAALAQELNANQVQLLLIFGGNPVYTAPADIDFRSALANAPLSVHLSLYNDETSLASTWHVNATHFLEEWGDARAHDGTATLIQPLIAPLYAGKSPIDLLNAIQGNPGITGYQALVGYWRGQSLPGNFDEAWFSVLHDGIVRDTAFPALTLTLSTDFAATPPAAAPQDLEIVFKPDPSIGDGFYANNGWLQELPKPYTKITWDNTAQLSPATAARLAIENGDLLDLSYNGRTVRAPAWIVPGQADETVVVHLGYGRTNAGRVGSPDGNPIGFNAYALRTATAPGFGGGVTLAKAGLKYEIASTQLHFALEGRKNDIVPSGTLAGFQADEEFLHHGHHEYLSLFPDYEYNHNKWGMSIDLNVCTGCNACVVACVAENNISVVGKSEVVRGREMQWIRIDQYFEGGADDPAVYNMPMLCQHCETAPCELVCPVAATSHDTEGLNVMTYNRCVGTKYCSNNCPYKVRRFNFLQYNYLNNDPNNVEGPKSLKLQRNPDVTVRTKGVMEKCTYCLQRINEARIEAQKADRPIADGEVITACQQACPTQAIVFGNMNDVNAQVTKLKAEPLTYTSLDVLNTKPRTSYMARLRNINPELGGAVTETHE